MRRIALTVGALVLLVIPASAYVDGPVNCGTNPDGSKFCWAIDGVSVNDVTYGVASSGEPDEVSRPDNAGMPKGVIDWSRWFSRSSKPHSP